MATSRITLGDVAPELRGRLRAIPRPRFHSALWRRFLRWANSRPVAAAPAGVEIAVRETPGAGLRLYRPAVRRSPGALLWIHGGGYVVGHPAQNDALCAATAQMLGVLVVAPRYRLAPEHPFPAALDDCHAVWRWMEAEAAALGIDARRIVIGGESAGGGIAAALVQRLHDEGGAGPIGQWLFCPMIDDRTAADRTLDGSEHFLWHNRANAFGWRSYLAADPGSPAPPAYAAPARREDLAGLPPAWMGTSHLDLFHAEDLAYAARLRAAGIAVRICDVPAAPHGFHAFAPETPLARAFVADAREWLRDRFDGAG